MARSLHLQPQRLPGGGFALWWRVVPDGGWSVLLGASLEEVAPLLVQILRGEQVDPPATGRPALGGAAGAWEALAPEIEEDADP